MEPSDTDMESRIRERVAISGRVVWISVLTGILLFSLLIATFFMEMVDSELAAAGNQMRLFVLSNTENFESRDDVALRKSAWNLARSGALVSHVAVFDPNDHVLVWVASPAYGAASDTDNKDMTELLTVQNKAKLMIATAGADLVPMDLPSGVGIYRAFTPVTLKKGTVRLGSVEMGFFKREIISRTLERLRLPGAVAVACVLLLIPLASAALRKWEAAKTVELTQFVESQSDRMRAVFERQAAEQKKEKESKDVDGGSFFNILESVREISAAPDRQTFVRRSVLASVRLFRCRMVSFYLHQPANGQHATWGLSGRYDGRGYTHELSETLDPSSHHRLKEALQMGATELLQGYPTESSQALLITVAAEKPLGAIILHNKAGVFDAKDLMSARIFSGFLPNLLAWHMK